MSALLNVFAYKCARNKKYIYTFIFIYYFYLFTRAYILMYDPFKYVYVISVLKYWAFLLFDDVIASKQHCTL